ncbi:transcriptional activator RfaH [Lentibacter algarum]|uniref:transcription termination/antitermination protein NusG n=1 Tax=Lentibacter algarum TaxID=576131 RepID=UPI00339DA459
MKQWYLIQFKPNSHRLAERNLTRQGFEVFLPMQDVTRRKAARFVSDLRPLFAGYMFVSADRDAAPWRAINSTLGVSRLVSFDGTPKPMPQELMASLMQRCDEAGKLLPPKTLNAGDLVDVLSGPFATFVATVEEIDAEQRVWLLMEFMGQSTRVHVAADQVQVSK